MVIFGTLCVILTINMPSFVIILNVSERTSLDVMCVKAAITMLSHTATHSVSAVRARPASAGLVSGGRSGAPPA